jgi:hypothetical protein
MRFQVNPLISPPWPGDDRPEALGSRLGNRILQPIEDMNGPLTISRTIP